MVESLLVLSIGCVGVLTLGEPTGLELPEVEAPGSGRLLPIVGEMVGGVTDDITMVGGLTDASTVNVPDVVIVVEVAIDVDVDVDVFGSDTGVLLSVRGEVAVVAVDVDVTDFVSTAN